MGRGFIDPSPSTQSRQMATRRDGRWARRCSPAGPPASRRGRGRLSCAGADVGSLCTGTLSGSGSSSGDTSPRGSRKSASPCPPWAELRTWGQALWSRPSAGWCRRRTSCSRCCGSSRGASSRSRRRRGRRGLSRRWSWFRPDASGTEEMPGWACLPSSPTWLPSRRWSAFQSCFSRRPAASLLSESEWKFVRWHSMSEMTMR